MSSTKQIQRKITEINHYIDLAKHNARLKGRSRWVVSSGWNDEIIEVVKRGSKFIIRRYLVDDLS